MFLCRVFCYASPSSSFLREWGRYIFVPKGQDSRFSFFRVSTRNVSSFLSRMCGGFYTAFPISLSSIIFWVSVVRVRTSAFQSASSYPRRGHRGNRVARFYTIVRRLLLFNWVFTEFSFVGRVNGFVHVWPSGVFIISFQNACFKY